MQETSRKLGLKQGIYISAAMAVVAFVATIVFVVNQASHEANRFALRAQLKTVGMEIERQIDETVRQQSEISYWDEAVHQLVLAATPDEDFIEYELVDWVAADFGFSMLTIINSKGTAQIGILNEQLIQNPQNLPLINGNSDLIELARTKYRDKRVGNSEGYFVSDSDGSLLPDIEATAIREVSGQVGIVSAQVIVPDSGELMLRPEQETVLLAFKPLTDKLLGEIATRMDLFEPRIVPLRDNLPAMPAHLTLKTADSAASLALVWRPAAPRPVIVRNVAPVAAALCLIICGAMFFMVRRHAKALQALAASEERNRFLASHDGLTGLANRKRFDEELDRLTSGASQEPFAVICVDLDRFKAVNDVHGHAAGDAVLKTVSARFAKQIGDSGLIARFGGDEFAAILTDRISDEELRWLGDALVEEASKPVGYEDLSLRIGASVGMAVAPDSGRSARAVMAAADGALYCSKRAGRGRVSIAAPSVAPKQSELSVA